MTGSRYIIIFNSMKTKGEMTMKLAEHTQNRSAQSENIQSFLENAELYNEELDKAFARMMSRIAIDRSRIR